MFTDEEICKTSYRSLIGSFCFRLASLRGDGRGNPVKFAALIGAIPFLVSSAWIVLRVLNAGNKEGGVSGFLLLVLGCAVAWMLLAPVLMTMGQTWVEDLLKSVVKDAKESEIRLDRLKSRLAWVDRLARPISTVFASVVSLVFIAQIKAVEGFLGSGIDLKLVEILLGVVLFFFVGLTSGEGVWGVLKTLTLEHELTDMDWPWFPFEPGALDCLEKMARYSYFTALIFSMGALFLPMTLALFLEAGNAVAAIAALFGSLILGLGSVLLLVFPYLRLRRLEKRQRNKVLKIVGSKVEGFLGDGLSRAGEIPEQEDKKTVVWALRDFDDFVLLWDRIKDEPVSPLESLRNFLGRLTTTLVIPVFIAVLAAVLRS